MKNLVELEVDGLQLNVQLVILVLDQQWHLTLLDFGRFKLMWKK
jgi:hypothetical protein